MNQAMINLYEEYTHAGLSRRGFLDRLAQLAGGMTVALATLPLLENNYARAETVAATDPRLETGYVEYPGGKGMVNAYQAKLKEKATSMPGVVVIHENRGLNPHIEDVTRRLAVEGFLSVAPDALSSQGGTPADEDKARSMIAALVPEETRKDYLSAISYLKGHNLCTGKVGCVGFCWGGGMANQLAVHSTDLTAAVSFYGLQPEPADVPRIKIPLLLHYAGLDERINQGIPDFVNALKAAKVDYRMYSYEGVNHAFFNDTNSARYDAAAAKLAWERTVEFLKGKLA